METLKMLNDLFTTVKTCLRH